MKAVTPKFYQHVNTATRRKNAGPGVHKHEAPAEPHQRSGSSQHLVRLTQTRPRVKHNRPEVKQIKGSSSSAARLFLQRQHHMTGSLTSRTTQKQAEIRLPQAGPGGGSCLPGTKLLHGSPQRTRLRTGF